MRQPFLLAQTKAIILSMTPAERRNPKIINGSRRKRIAAGSGMKVQDVNRLLKQFEQMQKLMKQLSGGKKTKMMTRRMRKQLAGMNFDKMNGKGGGNLPPLS